MAVSAKKLSVFILLALWLLLPATLNAQTQYTAIITGQVMDSKGNPVPHASLLSRTDWSYTVADASGNFTLNISEGTHSIQVSAYGYSTLIETLSIPPSQSSHNFLLKISQIANSLIHGTIVDCATNTPLILAALTINDSSYSYTDANGSFMLTLPFGRYSFKITAYNYFDNFRQLNISRSDTALGNICLNSSKTVGWTAGTIADEISGFPLSGAQIFDTSRNFSTTSEPDGYYILQLPSGPNSLSFNARGYQTKQISMTTIANNILQQDIFLAPNPPSSNDDHCNQSGTCATTIPANGGQLTGSIETPSDTDWFSFQATKGTTYDIHTFDLGPGTDTVLALYASDGIGELDYNDDMLDGSSASQSIWTAQQDTLVYIVISLYEIDDTGTYKLSVTADDDYCNTPGTCAYFLSNSVLPITGSNEKPDDSDWFQFTAIAGLTYSMTTSNLGRGSDTTMALYQKNGSVLTILAQNDDFNDSSASQIIWQAARDGIYYIEIKQFDPSDTGTYELFLQDNDDHCNNRGNCALILVPNDSPSPGIFEYDRDKDWFRFQAVANANYTIETLNLAGGSDTTITISDSNGKTLAFDNSSGSETGASYTAYSPSVNETLYIKVQHTTPNGRGSYAVKIGQSHIISLQPDGSTVNETLISATGKNHFLFGVEQGQIYRIETMNHTGNCDTVIVLYGPDNLTIIATDDDSGPTGDLIEFTAVSSGLYYIDASPYDADSLGSYDIKITRQADDIHGNTPDQSTVLQTDAVKIDGSFSFDSDHDWFRFQGVAGQQYIMETSHLTDNCDTFMGLFDSNNAPIAWDDDSGFNGASRLKWQAILDGTYYLDLRHFDADGRGRYQVWIRTLPNDDHPDTPANATVMTVDHVPLKGILTPKDSDWFQFTASAGLVYRMETSSLSPEADTVIELYDSDQTTMLASNDDGGNFLGSRITWKPQTAGHYFVRVFHFDPEGVGSYYFSVSKPGSSCISLLPGHEVNGNLTKEGDETLYCMAVKRSQKINIALTGPERSDFDLYLAQDYPPDDGTYEADSTTDTSKEFLDLITSTAGTLYITVTSYSGNGAYTLLAQNNQWTPPACTPIIDGQSANGLFNEPGEESLYCINLNQGDNLNIILDGHGDNNDFDIYLGEITPPDESHYTARGYTPFSYEIASMTAIHTGRVYILLHNYLGSGSYSLTAQIQATTPTCIPITAGTVVNGSLDYPSARKLYCMPVIANDQILVNLTGPASPTETDFDLYLKFGTPATTETYDASATTATSAEQILFTSTADGTLYITVVSYEGRGDYTLLAANQGRVPLAKIGTGASQTLQIRGRITSKGDNQPINTNKFCITLKDVGKFCYNAGSLTKQISIIPGGYFFFIAPTITASANLTLNGINCYRDAILNFPEDQVATELASLHFEVELDTTIDCDRDGMDTGWEKRHSLNIWKNDAALDFDKDGVRNIEEYIGGSLPDDKNSRPANIKDFTPPTITGLSDDTNCSTPKRWLWDADETAAFRYAIDQNQSGLPSGSYQALTTARLAAGTGIWYLHVQAMDNAGNESPVRTVSVLMSCSGLTRIMGDINGNNTLDLADVLIGIKTLTHNSDSNLPLTNFDRSKTDVNGDFIIGLPEIIFILNELAK